jgi:O-antigen/teichoic acid export membrane protein
VSTITDLTSGRLLARNTIINLVSEAAPFLVALMTVPIVVRHVGVDRYGVLLLSIMAVGYFGIFDLGLGSAATKFMAEAAAAADTTAVRKWFWTSLYLTFACGFVATMMIAALAPWLVRLLKIPAAIRPEALHAFYVLAASMPLVISGGTLNSALSAYQRFDLINLVRVPSGIYSYLAPLLVLIFSHSIAWIVTAVVAGRVASWLVNAFQCLRVVPSLLSDATPRSEAIGPMLGFGGWITVSAVFGPIMVYFDRFLIGAMLSAAAVTYYSVPFQVIGKVQVLPAAMSGVVFAAFSGCFELNPARCAIIFERATRYTFLVLFGPILLVMALAPEGLTLWMGANFATHSASVLRWLAIGSFINCLAWTPYFLLQAAHRPDLPAKLHVAEVPLYLALLWWMLPRYGVEGAAIVWTLRVTADMAVLYLATRLILPQARDSIAWIAKAAVLTLAVFAMAAIQMSLETKILFLVASIGAFGALAWTMMLGSAEREMVRSRARAILPVLNAVADHG